METNPAEREATSHQNPLWLNYNQHTCVRCFHLENWAHYTKYFFQTFDISNI